MHGALDSLHLLKRRLKVRNLKGKFHDSDLVTGITLPEATYFSVSMVPFRLT